MLCFGGSLLGQSPTEAPPKPKPDWRIVYGKGFEFGVREPEGWRGDTGENASKRNVNIIFFPAAQDPDEADVNNRVKLSAKSDENTVQDMNYDMRQYKQKYPLVEFSDMAVAHGEYKTYAKVFFISLHFHDYVAYRNPGPKVGMNFSFAMSKKGVPATDAELKAYESIFESKRWPGAPVVTMGTAIPTWPRPAQLAALTFTWDPAREPFNRGWRSTAASLSVRSPRAFCAIKPMVMPTSWLLAPVRT